MSEILNKNLKQRIVEISYKNHLSHIASCITSCDIIDLIYQNKSIRDPFILSNGHAGLALYCVLEKYEGRNAEKLFKKHGVHPNRDLEDGIWFSTGSLGQGFPTALGMALAHDGLVYCLTSDGEWSEGSCWEALRIAADIQINNLYIYGSCNGYGAYSDIDTERLKWRIGAFLKNSFPHVAMLDTNLEGYPDWIQGLAGHYVVLDKKKYTELREILS